MQVLINTCLRAYSTSFVSLHDSDLMTSFLVYLLSSVFKYSLRADCLFTANQDVANVPRTKASAGHR